MNCGPALANSSITSEDSSAEISKSMANEIRLGPELVASLCSSP